MPSLESLNRRIDSEFAALDGRVKKAKEEQLAEHRAREERLASLEKLLADLQEVWRPRLQALVDRFGDRVKVTPKLTSSSREAVFQVQSDLASIKLRLAPPPTRKSVR